MPVLNNPVITDKLFGVLPIPGVCISDCHINNHSSGNFIAYTCPSNKIAIANRWWGFNYQATTINVSPIYSGNGTIYRMNNTSESAASTFSAVSAHTISHILLPGESVGHYTTASGLNLYYGIIEFSSGQSLNIISKNTGFSSGNHLLCTAGNCGTIFMDSASSFLTFNQNGCLSVANQSNRTLAVATYVVPPGQGVSDHNMLSRATVSHNTRAALVLPNLLSSGSSIYLYTDGTGPISCTAIGVNL